MIAAIYATLCFALTPIAYGPIQFRFAEILMILPFLSKKNIIGLTLGCLIANMNPGGFGLPDMILGTFATLLACLIISRVKQKYLIAPIAAVINGIIVGLMIFIFYNEGDYTVAAYAFTASTVFLGELAAVGIGTVFVYVIESNKYLCKVFK